MSDFKHWNLDGDCDLARKQRGGLFRLIGFGDVVDSAIGIFRLVP